MGDGGKLCNLEDVEGFVKMWGEKLKFYEYNMFEVFV